LKSVSNDIDEKGIGEGGKLTISGVAVCLDESIDKNGIT